MYVHDSLDILLVGLVDARVLEEMLVPSQKGGRDQLLISVPRCWDARSGPGMTLRRGPIAARPARRGGRQEGRGDGVVG